MVGPFWLRTFAADCQQMVVLVAVERPPGTLKVEAGLDCAASRGPPLVESQAA